MEKKTIWQRLFGGWRTFGPTSGTAPGAFDTGSLGTYDNVERDAAMGLAAVWACMNIRAETIGTLPIHVRDKNKKAITDHELHDLLVNSPNAMQTGPEWMSQQVASTDMEGNGLSIIERRSSGTVTSLQPYAIEDGAELLFDERKREFYWRLGGSEKYAVDDILHFKGFNTRGLMGLPRLEVGRRVLSAQLQANESALRMFKQSIKIGGFLKPGDNLTTEQVRDLTDRLNAFAQNENAGKMMVLLKGMEPVSGKEFRISAADSQLLESRYFGVEEVCRIFNVPPQLIFHSSKTASQAYGSLEQVNLHYLAYSVLPTCVRKEARIRKQLLSRADRAKGVEVKYDVSGVARADLKTLQEFFASALQNGYYSQNDVLTALDRPGIGPEGDVYRVQMNMAGAGAEGAKGPPAKGKDNGNPK